MTVDSLVALLPKLRGLEVLVFGDCILDAYLEGIVRRISPEAPVPILEQQSLHHRMGGAANVALNLAALGVRASLAGVCGKDERAALFRDLLRRDQIDDRFIVEDESRPTALKTRVIAHAGQILRNPQQFLRIDQESTEAVPEKVAAELFSRLAPAIGRFKAVIISDYGKGFIHRATFDRLLDLLRGKGIVTVVDPKKRNYAVYRDIDAMTHNHHEAGEDSGLPCETDEEVRRAGLLLLEKHNLKHTLITRGSRGMVLLTRDGEATFIPTFARAVHDVSGAGDTVIAVHAAAIAVGASLLEAATLANHAAGVVVSKFGTATVTAGELEEEIRSHPLRNHH